MSDPLIIAGREFRSRLFLGTAGYPNRQVMLDSIAASGTAMVTASIRRISLAGEEESLIDEYRLMVFPVVLGSGKRLFGESADLTSLKLADSKPVGPDGVVILTYVPA